MDGATLWRLVTPAHERERRSEPSNHRGTRRIPAFEALIRGAPASSGLPERPRDGSHRVAVTAELTGDLGQELLLVLAHLSGRTKRREGGFG